MKKRMSMILAAVMSAMIISAVPACAADAPAEQYVTQEDGKTVVHIIYYVDSDSSVCPQNVTWYDVNGTKYVSEYRTSPKRSDGGMEVSFQNVTWSDAAGNTFVRDGNSGTVTVYDAAGNVIRTYNA